MRIMTGSSALHGFGMERSEPKDIDYFVDSIREVTASQKTVTVYN